MTTDEFIAKQKIAIDNIIKEDKPLRIAVSSITALISKRVWTQGLNSDGSIIGNYKGGEIYVSGVVAEKTRLPKFPLKGKTGESTFKNGKPHKSGYFTNYLSFKKTEGRNKKVQTVDLFLSGDLHKDWANGDINKPEATKVNQHYYYTSLSEDSLNKVARYGNVFQPTIVEKGKFLSVIQTEFAKALRTT